MTLRCRFRSLHCLKLNELFGLDLFIQFGEEIEDRKFYSRIVRGQHSDGFSFAVLSVRQRQLISWVDEPDVGYAEFQVVVYSLLDATRPVFRRQNLNTKEGWFSKNSALALLVVTDMSGTR